MILLKTLLNESTFNLNRDVDYIYREGGIQKFVKSFQSNTEWWKKMFVSYRHAPAGSVGIIRFGRQIDGTELPSKLIRKYAELRPLVIKCGLSQSPFYQPAEGSNHPDYDLIVITPNVDVIQLSYDYADPANLLPSNARTMFSNEVTEHRPKSAIYHELAHWLDDVTRNRHLEKMLSHASELSRPDLLRLGKKDVNMTYFEIEGQIHSLKQLKRSFAKEWDSFTLNDIFVRYTALAHIYLTILSKYGKDVVDIWQRNLVKRMHREGLLGKNMRRFVREL